MAEQAKRNWADIEDDEDHHNSKPVVQSKGQQAENVEYKLQATGESIPTKDYNSNRQPRAPKKPLLSYEEMISEIQSEEFHYKNVFIHCFGVNGTEAEFREAVEPKVKFINLIEHKNDDRDSSIDLKFDDKEEAVKFIQVGPKIQLNGRTFRIKFGKILKTKGEYSKFGDNSERRPQRDYRDRNDTDKREPRNQNTFQKKWNDNKEEQKTEEQEAIERQPALPFKPRGFINTKKEAHQKEGVTPTINQESEIKCVDMNAKIVEKQKTEEHHYIEHHHAKDHQHEHQHEHHHEHHHEHPKVQQNAPQEENKKEQNKKPQQQQQAKETQPKQNQKEPQQVKEAQPKQNQKETQQQQAKETQPKQSHKEPHQQAKEPELKQNHKEEATKTHEVPKTIYVPKNPQVKEAPKQKEEVHEPKVEKPQQEDEWTTVKSGTKKDKPSEEKKGKTYQPKQNKEGKKPTSDKPQVAYERKQ